APLIVIAASSPDDCFYYSYQAARLAMEHTTPVLLLSDSYLASGSSPWKLPRMEDLPEIEIPKFADDPEKWDPYLRDPDFMNRYWMIPGEKGFEHRIGGLEKEEVTGHLTYRPLNHQKMVKQREEKIQRVARKLPDQTVEGARSGDLLVVGWGSTYGAINTAIAELREEGVDNVGFTHFNYLMPLPGNTADVFEQFEQILVCELNNGQFVDYLRSKVPGFRYRQYNKIQGQPFFVAEIKKKILQTLEA
ncbi:MAG: hypothetical protein R3224_05945, partial [Balneolaceae bacterium]|nr:hypothetical protein [Balneolaceae bacterium]